jgi:S-adenosylmethionine-dependent methyltransferase
VQSTEPSTATQFALYQDSLASRLRYWQAQHNLAELHDLGRPLRVLDAAGGNGIISEFLLRQGHAVTLIDTSPEMLRLARERLGAADLLRRCELREANIEEMADALPHSSFDLILCHHVIEYSKDPPKILAGCRQLLDAKGEISLITLNPVSEVIRAAVFHHDALLARNKLDQLDYDARWFGQATLYPFEQILDWTRAGGLRLVDFRALRVLADYIPETKASAQGDALLQLELELAAREPYRRFGRYLQFCLAVE